VNDVGRVYLSGGHVYCARRRDDSDIERCLDCASLKELHLESSPPYLVCDTAAQGTADPFYVWWWHQHHRRSRTV
jgi:hypothetical protein